MLKLKIGLPALIMLLVFGFLSVPTATACGCCPPAAETRIIQNGRYVLVIIKSEFDKTFWAEHPTSKEQLAVYNKYKMPGLYRNDGSTRPLWTIDYEVKHTTPFAHNLYTTPDGQYLASVSESQSQPPLSFYQNGQLVKQYTYEDLSVIRKGKYGIEVNKYKFDYKENPFRAACGYPWIKEQKFYEAKGVLKIEHLDGRTLYFDIRTGEYSTPVVEEVDFWLLIINWSGASFVLLLVLFCINHRARIRKSTKAE